MTERIEETIRRVFHVSKADVNEETWKTLRSRARSINFGIAYGTGAEKLIAGLQMDPAEAQRIRDAWSSYFKPFQDACRAQLEKQCVICGKAVAKRCTSCKVVLCWDDWYDHTCPGLPKDDGLDDPSDAEQARQERSDDEQRQDREAQDRDG